MAVIDDLIAYYEMDGTAGASEDDVHGSNHLTDNNTVGSATGKVGNCRDFENASTHYLEHADNADLSTGDISFSFQVWINIESKPGAGAIHYVIIKAEEYLLWYSGDEDRLKFSVYNGSSYTTATWGSALSLATWYHVICTYDSVNDEVSIIVNDGTPVVQGSATSGNNSANVFRLATDSGEGFDGLMDEVGFWKKELSAAEITWLNNAGNGRSYADIQNEGGGGGGANPRADGLIVIRQA
jgi:hypothetical protein